jgi:hypothetical protein
MHVEMFCHVLMFYLFSNVLLVLLFLPVFSLDDNLVHNVTRPFFYILNELFYFNEIMYFLMFKMCICFFLSSIQIAHLHEYTLHFHES